jgi:hypothetical protein
MAICKDIGQSIDVWAPVEVADEQWTQFAAQQIFLRPQHVEPDESDAPEDAVVRLEPIDDRRTHVTLNVNYCAHMKGISADSEIGAAKQHLRGTLERYKRFVDTGERGLARAA